MASCTEDVFVSILSLSRSEVNRWTRLLRLCDCLAVSFRFLWPVGEVGRGRSRRSAVSPVNPALLPLFRPCTWAPPPGDSPRCTGAWSRRNTRPPPCVPPSAWPRTCTCGCGWCWGQRALSGRGRRARGAGLPCPEARGRLAEDGRCTQC